MAELAAPTNMEQDKAPKCRSRKRQADTELSREVTMEGTQRRSRRTVMREDPITDYIVAANIEVKASRKKEPITHYSMRANDSGGIHVTVMLKETPENPSWNFNVSKRILDDANDSVRRLKAVKFLLNVAENQSSQDNIATQTAIPVALYDVLGVEVKRDAVLKQIKNTENELDIEAQKQKVETLQAIQREIESLQDKLDLECDSDIQTNIKNHLTNLHTNITNQAQDTETLIDIKNLAVMNQQLLQIKGYLDILDESGKSIIEKLASLTVTEDSPSTKFAYDNDVIQSVLEVIFVKADLNERRNNVYRIQKFLDDSLRKYVHTVADEQGVPEGTLYSYENVILPAVDKMAADLFVLFTTKSMKDATMLVSKFRKCIKWRVFDLVKIDLAGYVNYGDVVTPAKVNPWLDSGVNKGITKAVKQAMRGGSSKKIAPATKHTAKKTTKDANKNKPKKETKTPTKAIKKTEKKTTAKKEVAVKPKVKPQQDTKAKPAKQTKAKAEPKKSKPAEKPVKVATKAAKPVKASSRGRKC